MSDTSWTDDRVVYVASSGQRITAGAIEELLAGQARTSPARPVQRRAAGRQAERDAVAARVGKTPANAPSTAPRGPKGEPPPASGGRADPRVAALELEIDDLEAELTGLRRLAALRTRVEMADVNYRPGAADRNCAGCVMYHDRSCDLVRGQIDPDGVCDRWEAR